MKKSAWCCLFILLAVLPLGCGRSLQAGATIEIIDMGGRTVVIPEIIDKVFCSNPIGTVNVYALAPERLAGWNFVPTGASAQYINPDYLDLPALGVWMGAGATPNREEIAKAAPSVILCFWSAGSEGVDMADSIQQQTGIPVILMDYSITATPEVYRLLGEYLDERERAGEFERYFEQELERLGGIVRGVPESERKSVFISQGARGLQTDPAGSLHVQDALDLLGLRNVAELPGTVGSGMGMPSVSPEQLLVWQPDAILVSEYNMGSNVMSNLHGEILSERSWANLNAVKNGAVYRIPQSPFSWFGKPPSAVRMLGSLWLINSLYPDYAEFDMIREIINFYELFYRIELTEYEAAAILDEG